MKRQSIYTADGKKVGYVQDGTFYKAVKASKHFLRYPPAIAFDIDSLHQAMNTDATQIKVIDSETKKIYRASIDTIFKRGIEFDHGYNQQIKLLVQYWEITDPAHPEKQLMMKL